MLVGGTPGCSQSERLVIHRKHPCQLNQVGNFLDEVLGCQSLAYRLREPKAWETGRQYDLKVVYVKRILAGRMIPGVACLNCRSLVQSQVNAGGTVGLRMVLKPLGESSDIGLVMKGDSHGHTQMDKVYLYATEKACENDDLALSESLVDIDDLSDEKTVHPASVDDHYARDVVSSSLQGAASGLNGADVVDAGHNYCVERWG